MQPHGDTLPNPGLERVQYELRATGVKPEPPNPLLSGIHSRGYLPHVKREGASYFVTFRLADALPKEVLLRFEAEKGGLLQRLRQSQTPPQPITELEEHVKRDLNRKVERYLDAGHGACHLRRKEIAELASRTVRHFEGEWYLLSDWVVMPNHVHVVLWPMPNYLLSDILKSWKQFISRHAKPILGLEEGSFWQRESFSHWIRNDEEKARFCRYIRHNPVTAGLCTRPEDWHWSSAWPGWSRGVEPTKV